jgi:uncharacterized phage protein gp47/JayE
MIQAPKSPAAYAADLLAGLQATGIQQTSPGGKARAFVDIVASKMGEVESRNFANIADSLLPFATGDSLDFLGEIYGVERIPRQDPTVSLADDNFRFFVRVGTFGDINGGQDISIPTGTRIFTNDPNGQIYLTTFPITLDHTTGTQSFAAESQSKGTAGNASASEFTRHNFTNYADAAFGSLLVTNNVGIVSGREQEDDETYRFRIQLRLKSTGGAAEVDLRLALLSVPGIQDIVFKPLAGTYLVYVYGIAPEVPASLLAIVQDQINLKSAYPLKGTAVAPDLIGISLTTTVQTIAGLSDTDKTTALNAAARAASDYINNLGVGNPLIINEISDRMRNADPRILDLGEPNKPLQEIFIWRERLDDTRYSRFLVNNYTPIVGERIVVESIPDAINLVAA